MESVIDLLAKTCTILPPRARGNCRIWFEWDGRPVFISAGTKKPKEARMLVKDKILAWYNTERKTREGQPKKSTGSERTLKHEMERYIQIEHEHSKIGTIQEARRNLAKLGEGLGWTETKNITKELYRSIYQSMRDKVSSKTWANELSEHRRFSKFLVREDVIDRDFTDGIKRPKRKSFGTREEIYKEEWFEKIWNELPKEWRLPWEDHWYTGMDTKDLWEFDLQKDVIPTSQGWKIWKRRAKEDEIIDQPLSSKIKDRWVADRERGVRRLYENASRYNCAKSWGNQMRRALHNAQEILKLPKLDLKTTRHTFVTRHLSRLVAGEKNAPTLDEVRRWLVHSKDSRELERTYLKLLSNPHLMD